jgi:hypothetical protein
MNSRLAISLASLFFVGHAALAQGPSQPQITHNPQVEVIYREPANRDYRSIYDLLKKRQVLEELKQFLTPLRLPRKMTVQLDQCGAMQRLYLPGGPVTICYELVDQIIKVGSQVNQDLRSTVIAGAFIQAALHETAYAIIDQLQLPVWGRASDAADRLAALVMLQFGEDLADRTIRAAAVFFDVSKRSWTGSAFAAIDSPEQQRFYNYLCIAYGGSPITFSFLAEGDRPILPKRRAVQCEDEYNQVRKAFNLRIMPFVDPDLLVAIRARPAWLLPEDVK